MDAILSKIGFDWHLALVNLVNVFLIFLVLKKWAFGPIGEIIEKRKTMVEEGIASVEKAEEAREIAEKEREETLAKVRVEATELIENAQQEASGIIETSKATALKEQKEVLHKTQLEIEARQKESEGKLRAEAANLVARGVKKILGEEVDEKMNERIVKKAQ